MKKKYLLFFVVVLFFTLNLTSCKIINNDSSDSVNIETNELKETNKIKKEEKDLMSDSSNELYENIKNIKKLSMEKSFYKKKSFIDDEVRLLINSGVLIEDFNKVFLEEKDFMHFSYPEKNIYCNSIESKQLDFNFELYKTFLNGNIVDNLDIFGSYKKDIEVYLGLSNEEVIESELGKILSEMILKNEEFLKLYNEKQYSIFKNTIYQINAGEHNDDILTILFFEKNDLGKSDIDAFLNKCYDYKNKKINIDYIKNILITK